MTTLPYVSGFSAHTPANVLTNKDLEAFVDTNDEWIRTRTGIHERRKAPDGVANADLAAEAARKALALSGCPAESITHIVVVTCSPDVLCPSTACQVAGRLALRARVAIDVNAACTGFVSGLDVARGFLATQKNARVLLIASETLSRFCDWADRTTCVLFGDGAGAVIMSNEPIQPGGLHARLHDVRHAADGSGGDLLHFGGRYTTPGSVTPTDVYGKEYFIQMNGREVFKHAVRSMTEACQDVLRDNNLTIADIDLFVPHQANLRIIEAVGSRLEVKPEQLFINLQKYGNTSAASIPIALAEAREEGRMKPGAKVLLTSFGGGFTWGAALLIFAENG